MSNKIQLQTNNNALDALIARVNAAKDTAASLPEAGSGSSSSVNTCTIEIINKTIGSSLESYLNALFFIAYENGEFVKYGGMDLWDEVSIMPAGFTWKAEKYVLNNIVCGSMMYISDYGGSLDVPHDLYVNNGLAIEFVFIPETPNVTHTFTIEIPIGG